jgi:hypothetical protein
MRGVTAWLASGLSGAALLVAALLLGPTSEQATAASPGATGASSGSSSCVFVVRWSGRTYEAVAVEVSPRVGRRLGRGVIPPCDDTGDSPSPAERIDLAALPGVAPRRAVVAVGLSDLVLVRSSLVRRGRLPAEVKELLRAPRCTSRRRVRLIGEWLGILGINGRTEVDVVPPYVLEIHVRRASKPRYLRAFLRVRVPKSLGRPLTREDIENVLWKGGDIATTVRCVRGRYVAVKVEARPS